MITPKMQKWLEAYKQRIARGEKKTVKDHIYLNRIHKRIDRELGMALLLAKENPEIFSGKMQIGESNRLRTLLFIIKFMNPKIDVQMVLKNLLLEGEQDAAK